ncbi:MAG: DUF433 domain-containing protein [Blastocatellia bacterium]
MSISVVDQILSEQPGAPAVDSRGAALERWDENAPPITTNPRRLSGAPVIGIQRMPVTTLLDYLMEGYSVDEFIEFFPGTDRGKVIAALGKIREAFDEGLLTRLLAEEVDY